MQPDDRDAAHLWYMVHAAECIGQFIGDMSADQLAADEQVRSAVAWQIIVLGEAARRLSRDFRDRMLVIDWQLLQSQRNFYAHEYDAIDPGSLWKFIQVVVPRIATLLGPLLPPLPPDAE